MDELNKNINSEIAACGCRSEANTAETDPPVTCNCCCIESQDITFGPCEDIKDFTLSPLTLDCQGRFLKIRVHLCNVCKGRCVNIGVLVCETFNGTDFIQGFKVCKVQVPTGGPGACTEITTNEFCFVLSEPPSNQCPPLECAVPATTCSPTACPQICESRTVKVKIIAHYSSFPSFPFCPC